MSIEHKAWLLDYQAFADELADVLFQALDSEDIEGLKGVVNQHHAELTDAWTEKPLPEKWEERLKQRGDTLNVLILGDIAPTKYMDPTDDIGLGYGFDALEAYLRSVPALSSMAEALIGGYWFGPRGRRFDPGYMGTGFVSPEQAQEHLARLIRTKLPPIPGPHASIVTAPTNRKRPRKYKARWINLS